MTGAIAQLPMYDWPEVRVATDRFWRLLAAELSAGGVEAPGLLNRTLGTRETWRSRSLLFGQTCGLPYVTGLTDHVTLLGRPSYAVEGAGPGTYTSAIVARSATSLSGIMAARGLVAACNSRRSQSGYAALASMLPRGTNSEAFFSGMLLTGSHRQSIQAIADGRADIAAIDCVSWHLACRHEPAAAVLQVVDWSAQAPSLPFITAKHTPETVVRTLRRALRSTVKALPDPVRDALMIQDIFDATPATYTCLLPDRQAA